VSNNNRVLKSSPRDHTYETLPVAVIIPNLVRNLITGWYIK